MNDIGKAPTFPVGDFMGLTIRDYFAAAALQGLVASEPQEFSSTTIVPWLCAKSYEIADAMIKVREAKK